MNSSEEPDRQGENERAWERDDLEQASENVLGGWPSAELEDPPQDPASATALDHEGEDGAVARIEENIETAKAFMQQEELMTFPSGVELSVSQTPVFLRDRYPVSAFEGALRKAALFQADAVERDAVEGDASKLFALLDLEDLLGAVRLASAGHGPILPSALGRAHRLSAPSGSWSVP